MEETVLFRFLKIRHPRPAAVLCWILTRLNGRKVMTEQMKKERARRLFLIAFVLFTFANGFGGSIISNYFKGVYQVDSVQRGFWRFRGAAGSCGSVCDRGTVGMWESDVGDDQLLPVRGGNVCPWTLISGISLNAAVCVYLFSRGSYCHAGPGCDRDGSRG